MFVARVAGNYAPVDLLGSTEYATKVAGAKLVVVLGHTECGAIKGACDNVELGNLTTVITALKPAVADVQDGGAVGARVAHDLVDIVQAHTREPPRSRHLRVLEHPIRCVAEFEVLPQRSPERR